MWQNKKNWNCKYILKTQIVTKFNNWNRKKKLKNSDFQKKKKNSNWDKTLKLKLWVNSKTKIVKKNQELKLGQNSKTQSVTELKKSNFDGCDSSVSIDSSDIIDKKKSVNIFFLLFSLEIVTKL